MKPGSCPTCGTPNAPGAEKCVRCGYPIPTPDGSPAGAAVAATGGPGSTAPPPKPSGSGTGAPGAAPPAAEVVEDQGSAYGWIIATILVAVLVIVAAVALLPQIVDLAKHESGPTATGHWVNGTLCNESLGVACAGNAINLPTVTGGRPSNVSSCIGFDTLGSQEELWLNFTASANVYGAVVPAYLYTGFNSWTGNPAYFVNNSTDVVKSAWFPGSHAGFTAAAIQLHDTGAAWCLGWWDPSGSATVTFDSNLNYAYVAP